MFMESWILQVVAPFLNFVCLLQSNLGFMLILQETPSSYESMKRPNISFIAYVNIYKNIKYRTYL